MLARGPSGPVQTLDGFVDSLLQTFENCRPGLSDQMAGAQGEPPEAFFAGLYEKEIPRLKDTIRREESLLEKGGQDAYFRKVDDLIRKVVIPAYVRLAARFTPRERNAFYLAPEPFHGLERFGWAVAGVVVGALVVLAPFIPLWSKEWIIPFMLGGLVFPNIRRFLTMRQYERELNHIVARADDEIGRIDAHYLTASSALTAGEAASEAAALPAPQAAARAAEAQKKTLAGGS
jgi:hypothetical protein